MKGRTRGAPLEKRATCPSCGKVGLGNTYRAVVQGGSRPYRQCRYCSSIHWTGPARKSR